MHVNVRRWAVRKDTNLTIPKNLFNAFRSQQWCLARHIFLDAYTVKKCSRHSSSISIHKDDYFSNIMNICEMTFYDYLFNFPPPIQHK